MEINNVIDVSQWQGRIDWDALKPYINGVIIRCGFGMDMVNQDDWQWARNVAECERLGIHGKQTTPYLLDKIQKLTGGDSLKANIQLVYNNARLGAKIAAALCE